MTQPPPKIISKYDPDCVYWNAYCVYLPEVFEVNISIMLDHQRFFNKLQIVPGFRLNTCYIFHVLISLRFSFKTTKENFFKKLLTFSKTKKTNKYFRVSKHDE